MTKQHLEKVADGLIERYEKGRTNPELWEEIERKCGRWLVGCFLHYEEYGNIVELLREGYRIVFDNKEDLVEFLRIWCEEFDQEFEDDSDVKIFLSEIIDE